MTEEDAKPTPAKVQQVRGQYEITVDSMRSATMRVADAFEDCVTLKASDRHGENEVEVQLPERFAPRLHIGTRLRVTVEVID